MKSAMPPRPPHDSLRRLIRDATGTPAKVLAQIENIMRDEFFHSTLDWQTRDQLADAAQQAFTWLNQTRELYDLDHACRLAMFQKMRAESSVHEHNSPTHRAAVADAVAKFEAARSKLFARLDETKST